jgi:hypothetical protein
MLDGKDGRCHIAATGPRVEGLPFASSLRIERNGPTDVQQH